MNKQQLIDYVKSEMDRWSLHEGQEIEIPELNLTVHLKEQYDEDPDLSHLGEFVRLPQGPIVFDRKTGNVTKYDPDGLPQLPEWWDYDRLYSYAWNENTVVLAVGTTDGQMWRQVLDEMGYATQEPYTRHLADMKHLTEGYIGYGKEAPEAVFYNALDGMTPEEIEEQVRAIIPYLNALDEWARTHDEDGYKILSEDGPSRWERHQYQYFAPQYPVEEGDPESLAIAIRDWKRMEDFYDNRRGMYGLTVTVEVGGRRIFRESVWGVELDGGRGDQETLEEVIGQLLYELDAEYINAKIAEVAKETESQLNALRLAAEMLEVE